MRFGVFTFDPRTRQVVTEDGQALQSYLSDSAGRQVLMGWYTGTGMRTLFLRHPGLRPTQGRLGQRTWTPEQTSCYLPNVLAVALIAVVALAQPA